MIQSLTDGTSSLRNILRKSLSVSERIIPIHQVIIVTRRWTNCFRFVGTVTSIFTHAKRFKTDHSGLSDLSSNWKWVVPLAAMITCVIAFCHVSDRLPYGTNGLTNQSYKIYQNIKSSMNFISEKKKKQERTFNTGATVLSCWKA